MVEDNKTIVIDNGTETIKAGFSTSEEVDVTLPTIVGYPKNTGTDQN